MDVPVSSLAEAPDHSKTAPCVFPAMKKITKSLNERIAKKKQESYANKSDLERIMRERDAHNLREREAQMDKDRGDIRRWNENNEKHYRERSEKKARNIFIIRSALARDIETKRRVARALQVGAPKAPIPANTLHADFSVGFDSRAPI